MIFLNQAQVRLLYMWYAHVCLSSVLCCIVLDIPKRPPWNYKMGKQAVESQESKMFEAYLQEIYRHYKPEELSHFEHNLEVVEFHKVHTWWLVHSIDLATVMESVRNI